LITIQAKGAQLFFFSLFYDSFDQLKSGKMVRNFLAIIAGMISCVLMIFAIEIIGNSISPVPVNISDREAFENYIRDAAPKSFYLLILLAYAVGSFTGAFVTSLISTDKKILRAMTVGGITMGWAIFTLTTLQYPFWIIISALFTFLPAAYLGSILSKQFFGKKQVMQ
jgi:hypothetical protein